MPEQRPDTSDYEIYPRTLAPDDFWGQVRRTVHGVPVGEDQIEMIADAIVSGLALEPSDVVLDLACGNGALSRHLYAHCSGLVGVDLSEYLISVAKANFEMPPRFTYLRDDAAHYASAEPEPLRFTKALCYGSFACFAPETAAAVLTGLRRRFKCLERVFIGNLPDRDLAHMFYRDGMPDQGVLDDYRKPIGIWRSERQMRELAARSGWRVEFSKMSDGFYAREYRYDAVLRPA